MEAVPSNVRNLQALAGRSAVQAHTATGDDAEPGDIRSLVAAIEQPLHAEADAEQGGASFDGDQMPAESLRFEGSGGSTGTVRASRSVTGSLSGGSMLTVRGQPARVDVEASGGSSVTTAE